MNETHDLLRMPEAAVEMPAGAKRVRVSHVWEKDPDEFYQEPEWCSRRLFAEETFFGDIWDPCCGSGTIVRNALARGFKAYGSDIANRGFGATSDFLAMRDGDWVNSVVCNPPFGLARLILAHALTLKRTAKIAIIFPTAQLNAAGSNDPSRNWISGAPLKRVWLMTPRPSMPPGRVIAAGGKAAGGKVDYCWMVFERGYDGRPELRWLRRDEA